MEQCLCKLLALHAYFCQCALPSFRQPYHNGKESRVPLQPPRTGQGWKGENTICWDTSGTSGLDLCSERASGEAGHRHEAGDGEKVCNPYCSFYLDEFSKGVSSLICGLYSMSWIVWCISQYILHFYVDSLRWKSCTKRRRRRQTNFWSNKDWWVQMSWHLIKPTLNLFSVIMLEVVDRLAITAEWV